MKKMIAFSLCIGILLPVSHSAIAQPRGPRDGGPRDGGPRDGGPGFGGGPRGRRSDKGGLMRVWRDIDRLEENGPALSKAQAKRVVALVLPWSKKPQMTQAQGQELRQKLTAILTSAQQTALDSDRPNFGPRPGGRGFDGPPRDFGGFRGDGPRGEGPPRGPRGEGRGGRGPDGRRPRFDLSEAQRETVRAWSETSNPFYAPTGTKGWKSLPVEFQKDVARRYKENRALLEALSRKSR